MVDEPTGEGVVLRPGPGRSFVIALGVGAWVPFALLLLGVIVTNGSYWSLVPVLLGLAACWLRARRVAAWRTGDVIVVRNFHSTTTFTVEPETVLRSFRHWAQPNFDCLALHTPGRGMRQVHATALAQRQWRRDEEDGRTETVLGVPVSHEAVGTWEQLRRRW